jgi:hypothetical protein
MGGLRSSTSELRILSRRGNQNTRRTLISLEENIRGIFSNYIPWDGLRQLGLTIRLEGIVAA